MAAKKTSLLRRRRYFRRYKVPSTSNYFRYTVDLMSGISKKAGDILYEWASGGSALYSINIGLLNNVNFSNFCKQYSFVRIKSLSYIAYPDTRNQAITNSGYVGMSVWPRGYIDAYGTWEKCADNPFFKILNNTRVSYRYCNLLGGDNDWRSTSSNLFTNCQLYAITSFDGGITTANAPQWLIKISVHCVFKSPVQ